MNLFVFIGGIVLLLIFIVILVRAALQASELKRPLYAVYLKIFLNHYQLMQVISTIDFGWPPEIQAVLRLQNYITQIPENVLSVDCLLMQLWLGEDPAVSLAYVRIISIAILP